GQDADEVQVTIGGGKAGKGNDQLGGNGREDRLGQHDQENTDIAEFGYGLDDPVGHCGSSASRACGYTPPSLPPPCGEGSRVGEAGKAGPGLSRLGGAAHALAVIGVEPDLAQADRLG